MELTTEQLMEISGGGINMGVYLAIGGLITFIIGVIDGYLRPLSCNK